MQVTCTVLFQCGDNSNMRETIKTISLFGAGTGGSGRSSVLEGFLLNLVQILQDNLLL